MKQKYTLLIPPRYAKLWYSWHYGARPKMIYQALSKLPQDDRGWYNVGADTFFVPERIHTKQLLESLANRIRQATAYQEGRLGKPLTTGCIYVNQICARRHNDN